MKTHTSSLAVVALTVAMLGSGCSSEGRLPFPTSPPAAAPTPAPPPPAEILYSLSGVVFEVTSTGAVVPVQNVEVYCEPCGRPGGHSFRFTDAQGAFSFEGPQGGVAPGTVEVPLAKFGFVLPGQPDQSGANGLGWMGSVKVTVTGDTRLDIKIERK